MQSLQELSYGIIHYFSIFAWERENAQTAIKAS